MISQRPLWLDLSLLSKWGPFILLVVHKFPQHTLFQWSRGPVPLGLFPGSTHLDKAEICSYCDICAFSKHILCTYWVRHCAGRKGYENNLILWGAHSSGLVWEGAGNWQSYRVGCAQTEKDHLLRAPYLAPDGSQSKRHLNAAKKWGGVSQRELCANVCTDMCVCMCVCTCPTKACSSTNYLWCLSKNPILHVLHLEIYCVPSHWAEGQREHFCESYSTGFLHLIKCTFPLSEMSQTDCLTLSAHPLPPSVPKVKGASLPSDHISSPWAQVPPRRLWGDSSREGADLCPLSWAGSNMLLPLAWLLTPSCLDSSRGS